MEAWSCKSGLPSVHEAVAAVGEAAKGAGAEAAVLSKEALEKAGRQKLLLAEHLATGARVGGKGLAKSVSNEFLLWLSGERQVSEAIKKAGARDAGEFGVVLIGEGDAKRFIALLGKAGIECRKAKLGEKADLAELERMAVSRLE